MEKDTILKLNKRFEEYAYEQDGIEYWLARELQELLEYSQWRNFENVIAKAKVACENSGNAVSDHFAEISKTIQMPKGASKEVPFVVARDEFGNVVHDEIHEDAWTVAVSTGEGAGAVSGARGTRCKA